MTNEEIRQFMDANLVHLHTVATFDALCEFSDDDERLESTMAILNTFDNAIRMVAKTPERDVHIKLLFGSGINPDVNVNRKAEIIYKSFKE